jgi:RNA polymerase sigma-70 factor (ECF subfamily)
MGPGRHSATLDHSSQERPGESLETHEEELYWFFLRCAPGRRHLVQDMVRDTLQQARRNVDHLCVDAEGVRTWLFTIARRIAIEYSRTRPARSRGVALGGPSGVPATDDGSGRPIDADTVQRALDGLDVDHRRVIVELYQRRRTVGEVARDLGIPEGMVKVRAYHGLRAMRTAIGWPPVR